MDTFQELREAIKEGKTLVWNDPDPKEDTDYTITWIEELEEDITDEEYQSTDIPILINYGESEAQIFLHEILYKTV